MKSLNALILALTALSSPLALAQTVVCPNVGTILLNGDQATINYAPKMGFTDTQDTASFVSLGKTEIDYRANKWGALISIPTALLNREVAAAEVSFLLPESALQVETCTLE